MDPKEFIITRKRKKYKFAKFYNATNCFELEEWTARPIDVIEIGAGTGFFSLELARQNPERTYIAIDVKADRLQYGAYKATEEGIENVFFVRARADQIDLLVTPGSAQSVWATFPDPFPRKSSSGRRLTHSTYLKKYRDLLSVDGQFYLKHDNPEFFNWSLEQLVADGWYINQLSFDLHDSDLPEHYKILTSFEQRWLDSGRKTHFVRASPAATR